MAKTPTKETRAWVILPDVHAPYHDKVVWQKVLLVLESLHDKLEGVVLAGDFLDLYSLSSHNSNILADLQGVSLSEEYEKSLPLIEDITSVVPHGCRLVYMYGNHEDRYWRYLRQGDNAKLGEALKSPVEGLQLEKHGYEIIQDYKNGCFEITSKLSIIHGLWTPVHPAKKHVDAMHRSVIFGHTHRFNSYHDGKHVGHNIGWLGDPSNKAFGYVSRWQIDSWVQGFAIVYVSSQDFWIDAIPIHNKSFAYGHKVY